MCHAVHMTNTEPMTSAEAAERLGIARTTLHRRVHRGEICALHKLPGRTAPFLFDRAEIERLAEQEAAA